MCDASRVPLVVVVDVPGYLRVIPPALTRRRLAEALCATLSAERRATERVR
jgi:acetyl-CoA carboxylase carboxyltransferase component